MESGGRWRGAAVVVRRPGEHALEQMLDSCAQLRGQITLADDAVIRFAAIFSPSSEVKYSIDLRTLA